MVSDLGTRISRGSSVAESATPSLVTGPAAYPLSYAQEAVFLGVRRGVDVPANLVAVRWLAGTPEPAAVDAALAAAAARHDALRTTIGPVNGRIVQRVDAAPRVRANWGRLADEHALERAVAAG